MTHAPRSPLGRLLSAAVLAILVLPLTGIQGCDGFVSRGWQAERQMEFLRFATEVPLSPGSIGHLISHLERELRSPGFDVPAGAVPDDAWDGIFDKLWRLRDTSDFDALRLTNLLYGYRGHPVASEALWQRAEQALLDFKYHYRDPTPVRIVDGSPVVDNMWYWSENHELIFRTVEFLAGRLFPDRVFTVTGLTGAAHAARARPAILRWLDERARFGFTEWHSNVYYNLDMRPLLALIEWSDDEEIERRSSMMLDLLFLDLALHVHRGTFGATHGRSYIKDKASADTEDTFPQTKMFFDDTELPYRSRGSASGAMFARARNYRLPEVIRRIALDDAPLWDQQRMNLPLDEVPPADPANAAPPEAPFGLDYRDEANLPFWWGMAAQPVWQILPLTLHVAERDNLWVSQFSDFAALRDFVWVPGDFDATIVQAWTVAAGLWPMINMSLLKEVHTATFRTPDYMLSTAQDYRKGVRGSQTHTWQATLSERAIVFTQHPGYVPVAPGGSVPPDWNWQREDEPGPGYWTGEASQPRSVQRENVGIHIYAPQYVPLAFLGFDFVPETHAYFPHAHMDEVVQQGPWTFGRKDDGYVALYSWRPTMWRRGQPEVFQNAGLDFDLVAPGGANNVWIVECGSKEQSGGFEQFQAAILAAQVDVTPTAKAFDVRYVSPSQGELAFGWEGPLMDDGEPVAIHLDRRFDNPYIETDFGETTYEIRKDHWRLLLDFEREIRDANSPPLDWLSELQSSLSGS
ncbi:MAG: hypothetical protein CL910_00200 [Deltaproteobacteria bacterium]|jgi:hypothetical protein|nr:hypothetical protein [Deltaproteobacteria bacterium]